jgi:hypothetical protein
VAFDWSLIRHLVDLRSCQKKLTSTFHKIDI